MFLDRSKFFWAGPKGFEQEQKPLFHFLNPVQKVLVSPNYYGLMEGHDNSFLTTSITKNYELGTLSLGRLNS